MDNTVKFCLELSSEGEEHLQEQLRPYPHYRNDIWNPGEIYQANGSVLRVWEEMDAAEDSPILNFIYETLETLAPNHYRYVLISPHGEGHSDGDYGGPHHLRLVHYPEVEYDPDGNNASEPQALAVYDGGPNVVYEQICSFRVDEAVALDERALRSELQDMSHDVRLGFVENATDDYLGNIMDVAEEHPGQDLRIRVFIRVEPAAKETSDA